MNRVAWKCAVVYGVSITILLVSTSGCAPVADGLRTARSTIPKKWPDFFGNVRAKEYGAEHERLWWSSVKDPILQRLIARVVIRSYRVEEAVANWERTAADASYSDSALWPIVQNNLSGTVFRPFTAQGTVENTSVNGVPISSANSPQTFSNVGTTTTFNYEIDLWRSISLTRTQGKLLVRAARADILTARWLVTVKLVQDYWQMGAAQEKCNLDRLLVNDAVKSAATTGVQYREGFVELGKVLSGRAAIKNARAILKTCEKNVTMFRTAVAVLVDEDPGKIKINSARLPHGVPRLPSPGVPAEVLDRRPDVHAARLALEASILGERIATKAFYPTLTLGGGISTNGAGWSAVDIIQNPLGYLGVSLALPILDWKKFSYERARAKSNFQQSLADFQHTLALAIEEVERSYAIRRADIEEYVAAENMLNVEKRKIELVRVRVRNGWVAPQLVRDALEKKAEDERRVIDARLQIWLNFLTIQKALGGPIPRGGTVAKGRKRFDR